MGLGISFLEVGGAMIWKTHHKKNNTPHYTFARNGFVIIKTPKLSSKKSNPIT